MKNSGMTFARINMSHADLTYVKKIIPLCDELQVSLIIDTEGAQVRTGQLKKSVAVLEEGDIIKVHNEATKGDSKNLHVWPVGTVNQLQQGDMISIDFDTLLLTVIDNKDVKKGYIKARVISGGVTGQNKSVVITNAHGAKLELPALSEKDKEVVEYSVKNGVKYIAASFMNSGEDVDLIREFVNKYAKNVQIISKIESKNALNNIIEILNKTDYALIDRGDLSKEISIEKIPLTQKIILRNGQKTNTPVYVATNLLETMSTKKKPTRAEVNDVVNTILDGASGLVLAGETAAGKYPIECVKMLSNLIKHSDIVTDIDKGMVDDKVVQRLQELDYLEGDIAGNLVEPHGGKLINQILKKPLAKDYLDSLYEVKISDEAYMDVEQIAIGTFSPLSGFMCKDDFRNVLDKMRLKNNTPWPLPIILDIDEKTKSNIGPNQEVALTNKSQIVATMHVEEIYEYDKKSIVTKLYGTTSEDHPGVRYINKMKPYLVGGKVTLIKRKPSKNKEYELTPAQTRKIFNEKGWSKVVGFHTRNVIHRSHEFIQLNALKQEGCDGLFVHPVIGRKKAGDYHSEYIIKSYELMMKKFYPKKKVVFGTFSTFSRYAGPREAIFTAICRKNFGCSHFIVGRDHTGVKEFYHPTASHQIFDKFPDLGIKPIFFNKVFYSEKLGDHFHESETNYHPDKDKQHISGTEARKIFESGTSPPEWYMRSEISKIVLDAIKKKREVFVK